MGKDGWIFLREGAGYGKLRGRLKGEKFKFSGVVGGEIGNGAEKIGCITLKILS